MAGEAKVTSETATVSCLRCGATYPVGAVVCFKCGAPIGETSIPTQPVAAVHAQPPEPDAPEDDPGATQPRMPVPSAPARPSRPARSPALRARRRKTIAYIALFTVLIAATYAGIVFSIRALTAGPPISQQTLYQDPQHRFHFKRPTLWIATPAADGVLLADSAGTSTVRVSVASAGADETAASRADALAHERGLGQAFPRQIAGQEWQRRAGRVTGADGAARQVALLVTLHAGQFYIIEESSPLSTFDSTDNLVYQPLLASFEFA